MKIKLLSCIIIFITQSLLNTSLFAQPFQRTYGNTGSETGTSIQHTLDGNYILSGMATSFTVARNNNFYLEKIDPTGNILWSKTYGGTLDDKAYYVWSCTDGGYILTGSTMSFGQTGTDMDLYLVKTDSDGNLQWSKTVGGTADDYGWFVTQSSDGGYLVTGSTVSYGLGGSYSGWL